MSLSLRILLNGATPASQIDVRFLPAQGHTDAYSIVRGDKDVTLHPIMALLVGAIMLHANTNLFRSIRRKSVRPAQFV